MMPIGLSAFGERGPYALADPPVLAGGVPRPSAPSETGRSSTSACAATTGAFVAAGFLACSALLPELGTPQHTAKAFLEAFHGENWSTAWALLCEPGRELYGDYAGFVENGEWMAQWNGRPLDVDLEFESATAVPGATGPAFRVPFTLTTEWASGESTENGRLLVLEEHGELRACGPGA